MKLLRKTNKKKLIIISAVVVVLIGGATAVAYVARVWPFASSSSVNMKSATAEQKEAGQKVVQFGSHRNYNA